ncbi:glycogen debranching enzyme [Thermocatellispora tengchongensis]|uniref:Glycogen debranching enzyme n=1 Tax=Thermocatellispora tengchongensis TaxID=1073253 RepID=A0A840PJ97_9ACTN|nr:glycogen debranching enzyme [Thermocatellispora tengchongensis]
MIAGEDAAGISRAAVRVLVANWDGGHTVPSRRLYPHQWSWDSAFIAIGNARWAPRRARCELLTLFGAQWRDGRVPHIAFNPEVPMGAYFPGPDFWDVSAPSGTVTSGIVQPPVHAIAAWRVHLADPDPAFLRRIYPRLVAQQEFLRANRRNPDGLLSILHPWESGMDNSPAWDEPLAAVNAGPLAAAVRRDTAVVNADERPTQRDYECYVEIARAYRDTGYRRAGEFSVADPLFNTAYAAAETSLAKIAIVCGLDPEPHRREAAAMVRAMAEHLYDDGLFHAKDELTGKLLRSSSGAGLTPLMLPGLPPRLADELIATALERFELKRGLLPSFAPGAPEFDSARYWRGPSWINLAWMVWQGLRHRRPVVAERMAETMIRVVGRAGFREYFDPLTFEGHGCHDFSWSAALVLDLIAEYGLDGVPAAGGEVGQQRGRLLEADQIGDHVLA